MSKSIKRILSIVSIFVLFFSLVSAGRTYAQKEELTNEEEYNLDYEYDQPVLYDDQGDKAINTNEDSMYRSNNLDSYSLTLIIFLLFFIFAIAIASLVFNIVMIVDCINRDEKDFKDRTVWLVVLIVGAFTGFGLIASLVYFFAVKKKLDVIEKK